MNERQLLDLLNKFHHGNCTEEETALLNEWFHKTSADDRHPLLPEALKSDLTEEMYAEFIHRLETGKANNKNNSASKRRILYTVSAVAATLLLFKCIGLYLYFRHSPDKQIAKANIVHDVLPGHNGAILTLADGSKVVLDSAGNKQIVRQGNIRITNTNGQLTYADNKADALKPAYNTLSTPRARQYKIVLPDGTKVWLNAASSITYPVAFTGSTREVSVTGETYFEVAHNARQPFKVNVNGETIEDIGTHFEISAYNEDPDVKSTLLEGSIRVTKEAKAIILKPGQQASVSNADAGIKVSEVNTENIVAWTKGFLFMDNNSVTQFMSRISRWYNVDVQYEGNVPEGSFGGMLNSNANLSDILSALKASGINTTFDGKTITVLSH